MLRAISDKLVLNAFSTDPRYKIFQTLQAPVFRALAALVTVSISATGYAGDWRQWRGPNGNNVAESGQQIPAEWSATKSVVWKVDVPGRGHSSPIIVDDLIVLTSADESAQLQGVFGFHRATGKRVWGTVISKGGFPQLHPKNTHASSTACSDGERVYATFNHHNKVEAVALDRNGKILWRRDVGGFAPRQYKYGYAASPTLYQGQLIVVGDSDTSAWVAAIDTRNGRILWKEKRSLKLNWSSPIVAKVSGREQLLLSGQDMIASYDPKTGQSLWRQPCLTMATCGTVVWDDDTIYASGGYPKKETVAMRGDGSGSIVWSNGVKCYEQSMLLHEQHLYAVDDNGVAYCWNAKSGREMWKKRLRGPVSASPVLVGNNIFASNERGTTFVFKANPQQFEQVAQNQLGDESFATPSVAEGRIYLRVASGDGAGRREMMFAIGAE